MTGYSSCSRWLLGWRFDVRPTWAMESAPTTSGMPLKGTSGSRHASESRGGHFRAAPWFGIWPTTSATVFRASSPLGRRALSSKATPIVGPICRMRPNGASTGWARMWRISSTMSWQWFTILRTGRPTRVRFASSGPAFPYRAGLARTMVQRMHSSVRHGEGGRLQPLWSAKIPSEASTRSRCGQALQQSPRRAPQTEP